MNDVSTKALDLLNNAGFVTALQNDSILVGLTNRVVSQMEVRKVLDDATIDARLNSVGVNVRVRI